MTFGMGSNLGQTVRIHESKVREISEDRQKKMSLSLSSNVKVVDGSQSNHFQASENRQINDDGVVKTRINLSQINEMPTR